MSTYLITQATGHQALWTINFLLKSGAKVHALVRDPSKVPSELQQPGITVFPRENDSPEALLSAAQDCKGVYINTWPGNGYVESEREQTLAILNACRAAGTVEVAVACTALGVGSPETWDFPAAKALVGDYIQSKVNIEEEIKKAGADWLKNWCILRPGFIFHDYTVPFVWGNYPEYPQTGTLVHGFDEGKGILHIDERDVGRYCAAALLDPVKFNKAEIELVNEYLTPEDIKSKILKVSGKEIKTRACGEKEREEMNKAVFGYRFQLWSNLVEQKSEAKENEQKWGIPFTSFEEYLVREKGKILELLGMAGI